jgi:hypothetical protein
MGFAFLRNSVVKFTIRDTHLNPRAIMLNINADGPELGKVYNNERFLDF